MLTIIVIVASFIGVAALVGGVAVMFRGDTDSAVLADQVKSLDWRAQRAKLKGRISAAELAEVRAKVMALVG